MNPPNTKIAITLYNLRDYCQTAEDLDKTLARLKKIGYQAVQISCIGPIEHEKVKELLDKHQLFCCATHEMLPGFREDFDGIVKKMKLWECDFTALAYPGDDCWSREGLVEYTKEIDEYGARLKDEGLKLGLHNHHYEFEKFTDKIFLEEIYDRAPNVYIELDVHHTVGGGGDPVQWIHKFGDRIPVIHFKDFAVINREPVACEVGEGNLNWPAIIKACEEKNIRWYSIEQGEPVPYRDIFDSAELSFNNLKAMGVS